MITTHYRTIDVGGLRFFYREAGPVDAPVLLLVGNPCSNVAETDIDFPVVRADAA